MKKLVTKNNVVRIVKGSITILIGLLLIAFLATPFLVERTTEGESIIMTFFGSFAGMLDAGGDVITAVALLSWLSILTSVFCFIVGTLFITGIKHTPMKWILLVALIISGIIFIITGSVAIRASTHMEIFFGETFHVGAGSILILVLGVLTIVFAIISLKATLLIKFLNKRREISEEQIIDAD